MKRSIEVRYSTVAMLLLALALAVGAAIGTAHAANRPASTLELETTLYGEPQSGTSVTTATASDVTASVTGGKVYSISCTTDSVFLPGSTVTNTTGETIAANVRRVVIPQPSTTTLAFRARASAGACVVNQLK